MGDSKIPKFKSTYQPKTAYGRDVVKPYYENNPTPSVAYMMGSNAEHKAKYGSDYGSEDVEALSREYVLYRDANGLSANYNAGIMPWVNKVRREAASGGQVLPGQGGYVGPMVEGPLGINAQAASGSGGAPSTVHGVNMQAFNQQANAQQKTKSAGDAFYEQIAKNRMIDNTKFSGGQPVVASVAGNNGSGAVNTGGDINTAGTASGGSAVNNSEQAVNGGGQVVQNGQAQNGNGMAGDSVYQQIQHNDGALKDQLDKSGLPDATIAALKAQAGGDTVSKNYQAQYKQAETEYAKAQTRFGQNAEYLAQSGLGNSGYSDASDNAAYAAMQRSKDAAGQAALDAQAAGQAAVLEKAATEETRLRGERETELLSFVTTKGLSGQEAINYLVAGGMDSARAAEIVDSQVDPVHNASVSEAAAYFVDAVRKGASPDEAKLILESKKYPPLVVEAALKKGNAVVESDNFKNEQDEVEDDKISEGKTIYADLVDQERSEEYIMDYLDSKGYDYEKIKKAVDDDAVKQLGEIFNHLNGGEEADIEGAEAKIKKALGIGDAEWQLYTEKGNIGAFMRKRADIVYADNQALRSKVYAESLVWDITDIDDRAYEVIADFQKLIDESARKGILTGDNLERVRKTMAEKLVIKDIGYGYIGEGNYSDKSIDVNVNGKTVSLVLTALGSVPNGTLWTEIGEGYEVGVIKDGNGNEQLVFSYTDMKGNKALGVVKKTNGGELYNALVNKYRGVGYRKTSGRTANR